MAPPVRVVRSHRRRSTVQARQGAGTIELRIPAWMSTADEARWVAEMERRFLPPLEARAARLALRYDLPVPTSVAWSTRQLHRWGSCTPGTGAIRISARLAAAPTYVLDYVVVHELAHLVVAGHGAAFDALVQRYPRAGQARWYLSRS